MQRSSRNVAVKSQNSCTTKRACIWPVAKHSAIAVIASSCLSFSPSHGEERLLDPLVIFGEVDDGLWLYGQVNKGVLVYDDGKSTRTYPLVDNANSSTRAGLWYKTKVSESFLISMNLEGEWNPYSTTSVNRLNSDDVDWESTALRKAELILDSQEYGKLWLGQGSTATDGIAEFDLSQTGVIAYSSVSDTAGGQWLAFDSGNISGVSVSSAFKNYDGLGRRVRIRYDTPTFSGFALKTSVGRDRLSGDEDIEWDLAGVYSVETDAFELVSGIGFSRPTGATNRFSASASLLDKGTGLNVTLAAAGDEREGGDDASYLYAKVGWIADLTDVGATAFAIDWYGGNNVANGSSDSTSVGISAVQFITRFQTELYTTVRWHTYDDSAGAYKDGIASLTGLRFKF
jgi:hypothetical protein